MGVIQEVCLDGTKTKSDTLPSDHIMASSSLIHALIVEGFFDPGL